MFKMFRKSKVQKRVALRNRIVAKKARLEFMEKQLIGKAPYSYVIEATDLAELIAVLETKLKNLQ